MDLLKRSSVAAACVAAVIVGVTVVAQDGGRGQAQASAPGITARHEHGYVKLGNLFYLLGGRRIQPVDIFNPTRGLWTKGAPPPVEIHHFQAVPFDGKIYLVGAMTGAYPTEPPLANVFIYDPAADTWAKGPEIPAGRRRGGAGAVLHNGEIIVIAGITNGHSDGHVTWVATSIKDRPVASAPGRATCSRSLPCRYHRQQDLCSRRSPEFGRHGPDVRADGARGGRVQLATDTGLTPRDG